VHAFVLVAVAVQVISFPTKAFAQFVGLGAYRSTVRCLLQGWFFAWFRYQ
jgi:hypothetical protein